jgi:microcystin-dependent protein
MSEVIDNDQPTMAVDEIVVESGRVPSSGSATADPGGLAVGFIRTFDDSFFFISPQAGDWQFAQGQALSIASDPELYATIGPAYGGNASTFDLPNLGGDLIVGDNGTGFGSNQGESFGASHETIGLANLPASFGGSAQPIDNDQPSVDLTYLINTGGQKYATGGNSLDVAGMVVPYAGAITPAGYLPADGQILNVSDYSLLYSEIGNTYGGNAAQGTFALPDLEGRTIVGASSNNLGAVTGSDTTTLTSANVPSPYGSGTAVNDQQPSLALNYLIYVGTANEGPSGDPQSFPSSGQLGADTPYLGEIVAYAGRVNEIPAGWMLADGQTLNIGSYINLQTELALPLNDGNGTTFTLPNLTGLSLAGLSTSTSAWSYNAGSQDGSDTYDVTLAAKPPSLQVSGSASFTEGVAAYLDPNATVTDLAGEATSFNGAGLKVQTEGILSGSFGISDPNFTLSATGMFGVDNLKEGGVTIAQVTDNFNFLIVEFNANATAALVNEVTQNITFTVAAGDPPTSGEIEYEYIDANDDSVTATDALTIQAVNDPPQVDKPAKPYTADLSQPLELGNTGLYVYDPDGENGTETLQISVGSGQLHVDVGTSGVSIVSGNDTDTLTLSGSTQELDYILQRDASSNLTYTENGPLAPASTALTLFIDDNGNTGSGGPLTDAVTATIDIVPCYCAGTRVRTARGHKRVETLKAGDQVRTRSGALRPVKWIGRRSYGGRFIRGNTDILPVCIKAGALADNVPVRDLWISPHHAMYFEDAARGGVLIEAKDLVNGVSVMQAEHVKTVEYFHVELDTHDVIVAEGAPSETYVDDDNRAMFHNAQDYHSRYPDAAAASVARYCAPRLDGGYAVEAVRRRIAARTGLVRAAAVPCAGRLRGFIDRLDATCIAGWAQNPDHADAPVCLDILADDRMIGQVLANRYREDLKQAGIGSGRHGFKFALPQGVALAAIEVRRSSDGTALALPAEANEKRSLNAA